MNASKNFREVKKAVFRFGLENPGKAASVFSFRGSVVDIYDQRRIRVSEADCVLVVPELEDLIKKQRSDIDTLMRVQGLR